MFVSIPLFFTVFLLFLVRKPLSPPFIHLPWVFTCSFSPSTPLHISLYRSDSVCFFQICTLLVLVSKWLWLSSTLLFRCFRCWVKNSSELRCPSCLTLEYGSKYNEKERDGGWVVRFKDAEMLLEDDEWRRGKNNITKMLNCHFEYKNA